MSIGLSRFHRKFQVYMHCFLYLNSFPNFPLKLKSAYLVNSSMSKYGEKGAECWKVNLNSPVRCLDPNTLTETQTVSTSVENQSIANKCSGFRKLGL